MHFHSATTKTTRGARDPFWVAVHFDGSSGLHLSISQLLQGFVAAQEPTVGMNQGDLCDPTAQVLLLPRVCSVQHWTCRPVLPGHWRAGVATDVFQGGLRATTATPTARNPGAGTNPFLEEGACEFRALELPPHHDLAVAEAFRTAGLVHPVGLAQVVQAVEVRADLLLCRIFR